MTYAEQDSPSATGPDAAPEPAAARRDWAWTRLETPIGPLLLAATRTGLVQVAFHADERTARRALTRLEQFFGGPPLSGIPHLATAATELSAYFAGRLRAFTVPLDWSLSSGFAARVLQVLATDVPYGGVVGYQDLADRVGEPGAARAVGAAMGSNPLPVVVPCHRVVASDGGIGGFGGGLETKRLLLALEGVLPAPLF
ncbi:methylated-DNA-[protein]-cysteine S-methyltransferase [Streptomyces sp. 2333.5]|uniref:methylated-DNA--[protein]-cysteine S-methyltransferase n=1 Tax=unclassified Streptomyces TaxID=2593676 RepID=UPI00089A84C6|nr:MULTISPECIES: methylated-DNA--[protein]-cysteine S-methyltransferase [unclassified Streptomyces]PJJ01304.1 methylated-DNA-[protein]-cysteine S-methyltransferase [Streptomyces sp. 2333.5]SEC53659.1 methylated-DNA-[protein]-cysteine S-methyltransferase [Streptomyces sp. 2314.4]SED31735.1 methylated-DNA-[protein]-cysteine S-methyltransferase [Streptomyces sp. 2112.2]